MLNTLPTILFLLGVVGCVYFAFRAYAAIRRYRYIGYFHQYRIFTSVAGALLGAGTTLVCALPDLWFIAVALLLAGTIMLGREIAWYVRAMIAMAAASRALSAERRRFREHTDSDRNVLEDCRASLKMAGFACRAKRFRDAYLSAVRISSRMQSLRPGTHQ